MNRRFRFAAVGAAAAILASLSGCQAPEPEPERPKHRASAEDFEGTAAALRRQAALKPERPTPRKAPRREAQPVRGDYAAWLKSQGLSESELSEEMRAERAKFRPGVVASTEYYDIYEYEPNKFRLIQTGMREGLSPSAMFVKKWNRTMRQAAVADEEVARLRSESDELRARVTALKSQHDEIEAAAEIAGKGRSRYQTLRDYLDGIAIARHGSTSSRTKGIPTS